MAKLSSCLPVKLLWRKVPVEVKWTLNAVAALLTFYLLGLIWSPERYQYCSYLACCSDVASNNCTHNPFQDYRAYAPEPSYPKSVWIFMFARDFFFLFIGVVFLIDAGFLVLGIGFILSLLFGPWNPYRWHILAVFIFYFFGVWVVWERNFQGFILMYLKEPPRSDNSPFFWIFWILIDLFPLMAIGVTLFILYPISQEILRWWRSFQTEIQTERNIEEGRMH